MQFGFHVSIAGGIFNAPLRAAERGCEVFQMFTRSPRGGAAPRLTAEIIKDFQANCRQHGFKRYYVHTPYYLNLASENIKIAGDSARIIRQELDRSSQLGATAVMTHLGSAKALPRPEALARVVTGLRMIMQDYTGSSQFLLEIAAGSGAVIGDSFDEIAEILNQLADSRVGVCFDTAHAFASGYDLRTPETVAATFKKFDQLIDLKRLALIHGNDSKVELNSRVDRHEHIGQGKIGLAGFKTIINHPKLKNVDMIMETPDEDDWCAKNLKTVKKLRGD